MNKFYSNNHKAFIYIALLGILFLSLFLGFKHSIYNQDFHHLFFILSMFIDFDNGLKLFKEIFLQYGPGQIVFLKLANYFIEINIVSISQLTSFIYSLNLFILFLIFKKITSLQISFLLTLFIFLIHPYSILPWPDYLSGISLSLFYLFFLRENSNYNFILCALFLFLAIFFRSTYILNILFSILVYYLLFQFNDKKNTLNFLFKIFILYLLIFFVILIYLNSLSDWFNQSLAFITSYAEETKHLELYDKITSYIGKSGFIFLKIIFYPLRSAYNFLNLYNYENLIFIFFVIINLIYLFKILKKKFHLNNYDKKILFVSILGLSGFVQALMLAEIFRIVNSTIGIFIAGLFFIKKSHSDIFSKKHYNKILFLIIIYGLLLFIKFPKNVYNDSNFTYLNYPYFENKKISLIQKKYYSEINDFLCNKKDIVLINITWDYAIPYICKDTNLKNSISIDKIFLKRFNKNEYKRIIENSNLKENEIFFSNNKIDGPNLELIKTFTSPYGQNAWFTDIYVYKLLN